MPSIDALARAIKEYAGGVVIVSHDFRMSGHSSPENLTLEDASAGLISQVANELWEVKNRTIRNLTREDISIVDYKKMLVKNSALSLCVRVLIARLIGLHRFRRSGEGQAVQQIRDQGQDMNDHGNHGVVHLGYCTPLCLYVYRLHDHRLDQALEPIFTQGSVRFLRSHAQIPSSSSLMRSASFKKKSCV